MQPVEVQIKPYKILFKFATRSRTEKFFAGIDNIIDNVSDKNNFKILVSADMDDLSMFNKHVAKRLIPYVEKGYVIPVFGTSKSKIDAINRDMQHAPADWDILVNFSDDMEFNVYGFDQIIREKFTIHFQDTNGNIYFNDGFVQDKVSTMSIIGRQYYNQFNFIYHPSYFSLWCDNEYTEIAQRKNKIQYFPQNIYTHNHAVNLGVVGDDLLVKTEAYYEQDKKNYLERQSKNFDIPDLSY
jgi:hypothetical protein